MSSGGPSAGVGSRSSARAITDLLEKSWASPLLVGERGGVASSDLPMHAGDDGSACRVLVTAAYPVTRLAWFQRHKRVEGDETSARMGRAFRSPSGKAQSTLVSGAGTTVAYTNPPMTRSASLLLALWRPRAERGTQEPACRRRSTGSVRSRRLHPGPGAGRGGASRPLRPARPGRTHRARALRPALVRQTKACSRAGQGRRCRRRSGAASRTPRSSEPRGDRKRKGVAPAPTAVLHPLRQTEGLAPHPGTGPTQWYVPEP